MRVNHSSQHQYKYRCTIHTRCVFCGYGASHEPNSTRPGSKRIIQTNARLTSATLEWNDNNGWNAKLTHFVFDNGKNVNTCCCCCLPNWIGCLHCCSKQRHFDPFSKTLMLKLRRSAPSTNLVSMQFHSLVDFLCVVILCLYTLMCAAMWAVQKTHAPTNRSEYASVHHHTHIHIYANEMNSTD